MTSPALTPPAPIWAVGDDDVAEIERLAGRRRAELSRLSLVLRRARMRAEQAEQAAVALDGDPDAVLAVVESLLEEALQWAQAGLEAARREAADLVAEEYERGASLLRALGLDPVDSLGVAGWQPDLVAEVDRPASAHALWRPIVLEATSSAAPVEEPATPAGAEGDLDVPYPVADATAAAVPPTAGEVEPEDAEPREPGAAPVAWLVVEDVMGSTEGGPGRDDPTWRHPVRAGRPRGRRASLAPVRLASADPVEAVAEDLRWPDDDPSLPVAAFPSRWPDAIQAAREFPDSPGLDPAPESMPATAEEGDDPGAPDRFDDFMRGPGTFDVFWGDVEDRQPLRDRLRRRTEAEDVR